MNKEKIVARQELALDRMRRVNEWPCYPFLPVKQIDFGTIGKCVQTGVIFVNEDGKPIPVVFEHATADDGGKPKLIANYPTIEALVADGWLED